MVWRLDAGQCEEEDEGMRINTRDCEDAARHSYRRQFMLQIVESEEYKRAERADGFPHDYGIFVDQLTWEALAGKPLPWRYDPRKPAHMLTIAWLRVECVSWLAGALMLHRGEAHVMEGEAEAARQIAEGLREREAGR